MKKKYVEPTSFITYVKPQGIICGSILGISGTGSFGTTLFGDEETDEYLARSSNDWGAYEDEDR